jgi:TetR/AcrR family transcriptional regulator
MSAQLNTGPSERSTETRARILDAALTEFSTQGLAGARTERIASAAGVNKALLYYYFESKEKLYEAAFEMIAAKVRDSSMAVFLLEASAGERVLRAALNHFDRILSQQEFQSLMQQEMIRVHKGEAGIMSILAEKVFEPTLSMYRKIVNEGIASGELIDVDWMQLQLATLGANVFYFLSAPVWRMILGEEPLTQKALAMRRKKLLEFLGQALFQDRRHGAELATRVFTDTPMPEVKGDRLNMGRKL